RARGTRADDHDIALFFSDHPVGAHRDLRIATNRRPRPEDRTPEAVDAVLLDVSPPRTQPLPLVRAARSRSTVTRGDGRTAREFWRLAPRRSAVEQGGDRRWQLRCRWTLTAPRSASTTRSARRWGSRPKARGQ